jgi:hypothetical protein
VAERREPLDTWIEQAIAQGVLVRASVNTDVYHLPGFLPKSGFHASLDEFQSLLPLQKARIFKSWCDGLSWETIRQRYGLMFKRTISRVVREKLELQPGERLPGKRRRMKYYDP